MSSQAAHKSHAVLNEDTERPAWLEALALSHLEGTLHVGRGWGFRKSRVRVRFRVRVRVRARVRVRVRVSLITLTLTLTCT